MMSPMFLTTGRTGVEMRCSVGTTEKLAWYWWLRGMRRRTVPVDGVIDCTMLTSPRPTHEAFAPVSHRATGYRSRTMTRSSVENPFDPEKGFVITSVAPRANPELLRSTSGPTVDDHEIKGLATDRSPESIVFVTTRAPLKSSVSDLPVIDKGSRR
ncbi:hypothetical protein SAMN04488548_10722 [Gordonia westfalica]|uniref:Uncharacterized protein n=2 Tax=Gordonia westfalica TaxID=158898 RepID=A0A1H2DN15_9ACTN|nr:hypothetical protein SAMN04488548_10722 [Gordonia westfalica]